MSQSSKSEFSEQLLAGGIPEKYAKYYKPASGRIPALVVPAVSERAKRMLDVLEKFVEEECLPADPVASVMIGQNTKERFSAHPKVIEDLKVRARELGLWNMFLPKNHFKEGAGFSNLEYGLMAEILGKSFIASSVLAKYGTEEHKRKWLDPLLNGKIRSAFLMTEPQVASSDATNIQLNMRQDGDYWVLNGQKWWSSGAGDPTCALYIVMGKSDPENKDVYRQQSVILVDSETQGITVKRMLSVFGYDDAPHGHGHIIFENVRVPAKNMVLGPGRGFEIIQGRLGPGRIHHAMRSVGAAEKALDLFIARANDSTKKPFGKFLSQHGVMLERIARSRMEIDAARLVVCNAAVAIDNGDAKSALKEIAEAKVLVPEILLEVLDKAIQAYGAMGVCQDTPLANMWAHARTMRIVDGPDEVHLQQLGRNENRRGPIVRAKLHLQQQKTDELFAKYGLQPRDRLEINHVTNGESKLERLSKL